MKSKIFGHEKTPETLNFQGFRILLFSINAWRTEEHDGLLLDRTAVISRPKPFDFTGFLRLSKFGAPALNYLFFFLITREVSL